MRLLVTLLLSFSCGGCAFVARSLQPDPTDEEILQWWLDTRPPNPDCVPVTNPCVQWIPKISKT